MTLSLDFPKNKNGGGAASLEQCLNHFCTIELLRGDNKYMCSNCKKRCEAKKRFSIESTPRVLIVHIKRFTNFGTKIKDFVKYPKILSLSGYMSSKLDQQSDPKYNPGLRQSVTQEDEIFDLYGVVVHQGGGCRSGHYYSYAKGFDEQWYDCNDDYVSRVHNGVDGVLQ